MYQGSIKVKTRNISYGICVLTIFHLTAYNLQSSFCHALPSPIQESEDLIDDVDIVQQVGAITNEEQREDRNLKTLSSTTYMDHKNLFCGTRISDLVTLNVTAR